MTPHTAPHSHLPEARVDALRDDSWWRHAVIYQVYPRSFADADGDGVGDIAGILSRIDDLSTLGVDALWLSPFYPSPQNDAGYDVADYLDVDPVFGTLDDFDALIVACHSRGMRIIVDIVPNHTSSDHAWFQEALGAEPGSTERSRYIFRNGRGPDGSTPPNNWQSVFGGPAWTRVSDADGMPGQWYLHLFDRSQPDLDWTNPWVADRFDEILRFWLDRGVDGFRVDVAHGLVKHPHLPDHLPTGDDVLEPAPYWAQPGVHDIFRRWRCVLEEYGPDRILCAEAWVAPLAALSDWVRPDEMHQAFNFEYLYSAWDAEQQRAVIDESLAAFGAVGAPSTWVLSNHDVVRHTTRLALNPGEALFGLREDTVLPDAAAAQRRARAATALMLALPGSAYLYQGEELGLDEVLDIPADARHDPTYHRTEGRRLGRDGCRVPLPWTTGANLGFGQGDQPWLPQPARWSTLAHSEQKDDPSSTLEFYRRALRLRREFDLGAGSIEWTETPPSQLQFARGRLTVLTNFGENDVPLPAGRLVLASSPLVDCHVPIDTTVWVETE